MGNRDINQSYNEVLPRASQFVVSRRPSQLTDVREQLDGLTASDVIWTPYDSHRISQSYTCPMQISRC